MTAYYGDPNRIQVLVFAEAVPSGTVTTPHDLLGCPQCLLRKMITDKISETEVVVDSMESSIRENKRHISASKEEIAMLRKQLVILNTIGEVAPTETLGWTIVECACSFAGENLSCGRSGMLASINEGKAFSEKSGGGVGGFDASERDKGGCWPRGHSPNEIIHNIQLADGTTRHTLTRLYIAPGASLALLKKLENKYKVVYDQ